MNKLIRSAYFNINELKNEEKKKIIVENSPRECMA